MSALILSTLNARYAHASLGLRYLFANLDDDLRAETKLAEFVIGSKTETLVEQLLALSPKVIGFGVYIWNVEETTRLIAMLKAVAPEIKVVIGGPEVSFETTGQRIFALADYVVTGQGDVTFNKLARALRGDALVREGSPAAVITAVAGERESDLLILSTQGHTGLKRFLLGSTAEAVVRRAPCPVLTVRPCGSDRARTSPCTKPGGMRSILVPVDFSERSRSLIQYAAAFAARFGASLVLLHVVDHIDIPSRVAYMATGLQLVVLERGIRQLQELAQRSLPPGIQAERIVRVGTPYDVIRRVASLEHTDLIIIATRTHGGLQRILLGSTAARVVRHAPCPVLVLR